MERKRLLREAFKMDFTGLQCCDVKELVNVWLLIDVCVPAGGG